MSEDKRSRFLCWLDRTPITKSYLGCRANIDKFLDQFMIKFKCDGIADFNKVEAAWEQYKRTAANYAHDEKTGIVRQLNEQEAKKCRQVLDDKYDEQVAKYLRGPLDKVVAVLKATDDETPLFDQIETTQQKPKKIESYVGSKSKKRSRTFATSRIRTKSYPNLGLGPYECVLLMPSDEMADVVQGFKESKFNDCTKFLFVENVKSKYDSIKESWKKDKFKERLATTAKAMGYDDFKVPDIRRNPTVYYGQIEDLTTESKVWSSRKGQIDYAWLDYKGNCTPARLQWWANTLIPMMRDSSDLAITTHAAINGNEKTNMIAYDDFKQILTGDGIDLPKGYLTELEVSLNRDMGRRYGRQIIDNLMIGAALVVGQSLEGDGCVMRRTEFYRSDDHPLTKTKDLLDYSMTEGSDKMCVHKFHVTKNFNQKHQSNASHGWNHLKRFGWEDKMFTIIERLLAVLPLRRDAYKKEAGKKLPSYNTNSDFARRMADRTVPTAEQLDELTEWNRRARIG